MRLIALMLVLASRLGATSIWSFPFTSNGTDSCAGYTTTTHGSVSFGSSGAGPFSDANYLTIDSGGLSAGSSQATFSIDFQLTGTYDFTDNPIIFSFNDGSINYFRVLAAGTPQIVLNGGLGLYVGSPGQMPTSGTHDIRVQYASQAGTKYIILFIDCVQQSGATAYSYGGIGTLSSFTIGRYYVATTLSYNGTIKNFQLNFDVPAACPATMCTAGTPTFTPTASPTITQTFTNSPTPTFTPTITQTHTFSPTITQTFSVSPTPTWTKTSSPTWTMTFTYSPTLTATPTWTRTWTPTASPTWTPTATPSATPTWSPTITLTATPSASPTVTPTATRTVSPTPTVTLVVTPIPAKVIVPVAQTHGNKFDYHKVRP